MKKLIALLMLTLMVGAASAQLSDLDSEVLVEARSQGSNCVDYLSERYPRVDTERIERFCYEVNADSRLRIKTNLRTSIMDLDLTEEQMVKLRAMDQERARQVLESGDVQGELANYRLRVYEEKEDMFRERVVNTQQARARFQLLKDQYEDLKDDLQEEREAFRDAVRSGDDEDAMIHAKAYLQLTADAAINSLERMKSQVEENDDLTEEEASDIIADIDAKIDILVEAKADVEAAQTKEEIKEAGLDIIHAWSRMKHQVKIHAGRIVKASVQDVLKRSEYLAVKTDRALTELEQDYDTSELVELKAEFNAKIEAAREHFAIGAELLNGARMEDRSQEEADRMVEEGKEHIQEAHKLLEEAHEISKEIMEKSREMTGNIDAFVEEDGEYVLVEREDYDDDLHDESDDYDDHKEMNESDDYDDNDHEETDESDDYDDHKEMNESDDYDDNDYEEMNESGDDETENSIESNIHVNLTLKGEI